MVETLQTGKPIDFSIMPSFECNLNCWFCMYDCNPNNHINLDFKKASKFINQIDWSMINICGFYGSEPSINIKLYNKFIELIPLEIPRFVITNGTWSTDYKKTEVFLYWCIKKRLQIIISSTPEHIKNQKRNYIENLKKEFDKATPRFIIIKEPDEIHAQGRAKNNPNVINFCKFTCQRSDRNTRLGLKPDGNIVYQNCHGEYHIVQTYNDPFDGILDRTKLIVDKCLKDKGDIINV